MRYINQIKKSLQSNKKYIILCEEEDTNILKSQNVLKLINNFKSNNNIDTKINFINNFHILNNDAKNKYYDKFKNKDTIFIIHIKSLDIIDIYNAIISNGDSIKYCDRYLIS